MVVRAMMGSMEEQGNDYVDGGEGRDIYHFSINSGNDTFQSRFRMV